MWWVLGTVVVIVAVAFAVTGGWRSDSPAVTLGEWTGRAIVPGVVIGLIAHLSSTAWPWWRYPVFIVGPTILLSVVAGVQDHERNVETVGASAEVHPPDRVGQFRRMKGPEVKDLVAQERAAFEKILGDGNRIEVAPYSARSDRQVARLLLIAVNMSPDGGMAHEFERAPEGSLRNMLKTAGVSAAIEQSTDGADGLMSCGDAVASAARVTICGWYAKGRVAMLVDLQSRPIDAAADLTREFRRAAESG